MKKLWFIILTTIMVVNIMGCRSEVEPGPPQEEPQETVEYPYNQIEADNIEGLEIFSEDVRTPMLKDPVIFKEVATLIQQAELVENGQGGQGIEGQWGMKIHLKEEILESSRVLVRPGENDNPLYIGPEGREFLIESPKLVEFIQNNLEGRFLIVEEKALSQGARDWFQQFENQMGGFVYQHPDATYIKITAEEKPTGGYEIQVREFDEEAYPEEIIIEITEPGEGEMVTQAITYPTIYLKIESEKATQYQVKTLGGEEYPMEHKLVFAKLEIPEENVIIDNPVRVKGKIIAFEGSFVVRLLDESDKIIHEEFLQSDHGGPNWGNFDEEISYPETPAKEGRIELGEYSAEDGTYQLREKVPVKFK